MSKYTKVTKSQVKSLIKKRKITGFWMCPSNCYPHIGHEWKSCFAYYISRSEVVEGSNFEDVINAFSYYNCTYETGYRVHYYIEEE